MEKIQRLLQRSVQQYKAIHQEQTKLSVCIEKSGPDSIKNYCLHLDNLQSEARETDAKLSSLINTADTKIISSKVFHERLELMRKIKAQNDLLFPKINGMLGLISSELSQTRKGIAGMAGYKSSPGNSGRIINNSF